LRQTLSAEMATVAEYQEFGRKAIEALLDRESALVYQELIAKAADQRPPEAPLGVLRVDPHHLNAARQQLLASGEMTERVASTRGQRRVTVMHRPLEPGTTRAILDAAARKRSIYGRYLSWASGSPSRPSITSRAGERAVHESIREAGPEVGYAFGNPDTGETEDLFGMAVPFGPLDNGVRYFDFTEKREFVLPIEVKNIRDWIYPADAVLHQLLAKAGRLQADHPDVQFVPVLVCRRAQRSAFRFANDLGFHIVDAHRQFILPRQFEQATKKRQLDEVRMALGFFDLHPWDTSYDRIVKQFRDVIPNVANRRAARWAVYGPRFADEFDAIRQDPEAARRQELLAQIRNEMRAEPDPYHGVPVVRRGW
jgi:hypothetical protein